MKKSLLISLFSILCFLGTTEVQAQEYTSSVGLRLGYPISASFKMFINDAHAIEAFVNYRRYSTVYDHGWSRLGIGGAYQIHSELDIADGLSWYYGAGASVLFFSYDDFYGDDYSSTAFALQGNVGLDYAFANLPINLSLDWVPTYYFGGYGSGFGYDSGALSIRYIISE